MKKKSIIKQEDGIYVVIKVSARSGNHIARSESPTKLHRTLTLARDEAERLAVLFIGSDFAVFKCDSITSSRAPLPTWRIPAGKDIPEDDSTPF